MLQIRVRNNTEKTHNKKYFPHKIIIKIVKLFFSLHYEARLKNVYLDWFIIRKVTGAGNLQFLNRSVFFVTEIKLISSGQIIFFIS